MQKRFRLLCEERRAGRKSVAYRLGHCIRFRLSLIDPWGTEDVKNTGVENLAGGSTPPPPPSTGTLDRRSLTEPVVAQSCKVC